MMYCFGELCTVFFLTVGGAAMFVLAVLIAEELIIDPESSAVGTDVLIFSYGKLFLAAAAAAIIIIIAVTPLSYGVGWYRIQQIRGVSVHARSIFSCYTSSGKLWQVLRLNSILIIKKLYIVLPLALIAAALFYLVGLAGNVVENVIVYYMLFFGALLVTFCLIVPALMLNVRYAAVPYLYVLGSDKTAAELIAESKRIMKGKGKYIAEVMFSLSWWLIPCLIIFPMIFIIPYIHMVYTAAINEIILDENIEEEHTDGSVNAEVPLTV